MEEKLVIVLNEMAEYLNVGQMKKAAGGSVQGLYRKCAGAEAGREFRISPDVFGRKEK